MQFGGYRIDAVHRIVAKPGGAIVRLEPKAFDLLVYFAAHPQETLSKQQLIDEVWGGKFVTEDAVMVAVYALRQAFDDDSKAPRFIETIRGRGYRWIVVADIADDAGGGAGAPLRTFRTALYATLVASMFAALVSGVLRPVQTMPSLQKTNALVRAQARGLFFSERPTRADLEAARAEFAKAIVIDERFAEPHAALAEACVRLIEFGAPNRSELEAQARREVARALDLGPQLAISHAALASVQFVLDRDADRAEESFRHAIDLDPSLPDIHRRYSYLLGASGRFVEATEQARMATEMEPTSASALNDLAWTYVLAHNFTDAERIYREALQLDPNNSGSLFSLGYCLEMRNAPADAMQSYRRALQIMHVADDRIAQYDRTFAESGMRGVYAAWFERMKPNASVPRYVVALYAIRAGRPDEAIEMLRQSAERREPGTLWLAVHPAFASLHGQREFAALVASSFHTR